MSILLFNWEEKFIIEEKVLYIKERDNYNVILYIILISSQYIFENILKNTKNIISKSSKNIKVRITYFNLIFKFKYNKFKFHPHE